MSGLFSRSKVHLSTPHFIVIDLVTIGLGKFSKLFSSKRMFKKNIQCLCLQTTKHGGTRPLSQREREKATVSQNTIHKLCIKCELLNEENEYITNTK